MQNTPKYILSKFFGFGGFRSGQLEIIDAVLEFDNVLAVLPTGAGKSLCYQIPALLSENFSIVISPLIALMKDQVDALNRKKEVAAFINSTMSYSETEEVLNKIALGSIKILYLAPERVEVLKFAERIKALNPQNIFIDEAHCISEWGHNFRPSYLRIKDFVRHISVKKVSAFTATATPEVREDIIQQLGFKEPKIFVRGFERDNLHLTILQTKKKREKCFELLKKISGPAIIYTSSRRKTEEAAEYLNMNGIKCNYYHAGLSAAERRRVQEEFLQGRIDKIAATNAFGMGIDKSDIRVIIHFNTPGSIESYYQEIGRAGRDGTEAYCFLLYDESDLAIQNYFISNSHPSKEQIQKIYKAICDYNRIAVGSVSEKELIVDKDYIAKYIAADISSALLHSAIKHLEHSGYLSRISEYDKKDTIQILFSADKLKHFMQNSITGELINVLVLLLREFGNNIFSKPVKFSSVQLSNKLSISEQIFIDSLTVLENMGIISFQQAIDRDTVRLTTPRVDAQKLNLNYKLINESYLNSLRKLDRMNEYVFSIECRFKNILSYFGEKVPDYRCGKCDNCTSLVKLNQTSAEYLAEIIQETLEEATEEIPENFLISVLKGEKIKKSASLFRHFGSCKKYTRSEIKTVLSQSISKGEIIKSIGRKNYLRLPDRAKVELSIPTFEQKEKLENYNQQLYLYNQLREARQKAAARFTQSAYLICSDNILREVASVRPKSKFELLGIRGFNSRMFNKIGNDFLQIINAYKPEQVKAIQYGKTEQLPSDIVETKKLLEKKYTLKEIAQTRKLTEAVISMQIETIVEFEPATDISKLVDDGVIKNVIVEAGKGFENLKDLKERLPSKITYPQIRIAIAKFKADSRHST